MKRLLFMALASAMLFAAPAVNAQRVNADAILKKLEKSDAEINDAKKNVKAATWINRAKVYFESIQAPTKDLFPQLTDPNILTATVGTPSKTEGDVWVYPWVTIYFKGNMIAWEQTKEIYPNAINVVLESLQTAYDLDPKSASKIKNLLDNIVKFYRDQAAVSYDIPRYDIAAKAYETVYDAQCNPAYGTPDYENLFFAGQLCAFMGSNDPEMFVKGEQMLKTAIDGGFADGEGNIYYYLFHCYYGQKAQDASKVIDGKNALLMGIEKFPKNERILDGLMQLYTSEDGVGDPADLIEMIDKALADDPENADLWFGRGRVYFKLNDYDECIASFRKVVEIKPDLFEGNYYLALFYMAKGDKVRDEVNSRDYKSQSEYDAEWLKVLDIYKDAVPWFERSLEINPNHLDTVDCLKSLCARLRDESDEYMEKFQKYSAMWREMSGN